MEVEDLLFTTQLVARGSGEALELDQIQLQVVEGPDRGLSCTLESLPARIGTSRAARLVLHDPTVSAHHAEVRLSGGRFVLHDLGSSNGVRVGGALVDGVVLHPGLQLQLGRSAIVARCGAEKTTIELCPAGTLGQLIVISLSMRALGAQLVALASTDTTVLIEGETGTGKELVARTLHDLGPRARGPFVIADCGAVPEALAPAELFGVEAGAYTGAERSRRGLFEQAHGGTLLLDEIGELPLPLQASLLGVLERRASRRVGGTRPIAHDVRVLAATNRNLQVEAASGRFRQDLYYRLAVGRLLVPPLRDRREDVLPLARRLAERHDVVLTPKFEQILSSYLWPGNVRELDNLVQCFGTSPSHALAQLRDPVAPSTFGDTRSFLRDDRFLPLTEARRALNAQFECDYVRKVMSLSRGHIGNAAKLAGVSDSLMSRLVAKHDLKGERWR